MGSYQSGQLGLTVTQLSFDFVGSNPALPTTPPPKGGNDSPLGGRDHAKVAQLIEH